MLVFLCLAALMLLACGLYLVRAPQRVAGATPDSPEWAVLRAKRDEIETDPTLTEDARAVLRTEWALQADAALAHAAQNTPDKIQVPHDRHFKVWLGVALTAAVGVYALIGNWQPDAMALHRATPPLMPQAEAVPPRDTAKHPGDNQSLDERIAGLKAKLQANPDDLNGWVLLARSYGIQRRFAEGAQALERALALQPAHPDLLADLADMLAMTQGKNLAGRPMALIEQALKSDPTHPKALALAATAAMSQGDTARATDYWTRLRASLPADDPGIAQIDATLESLAGRAATPARAAPSPAPSSTPTAAQVSGMIELDPALGARLKQRGLPDQATLFVVAKASGGMPMPVAVWRTSPQTLLAGQPLPFRLDDTLAMSPQMTLSSHSKVDVEARISMSGTASRSPEDVSVKVAGVSVGAQGLRLVLK